MEPFFLKLRFLKDRNRLGNGIRNILLQAREESAHENYDKIEALVCLTPFSEEQWKFYRHEMF